jgi:hypothetical protein
MAIYLFGKDMDAPGSEPGIVRFYNVQPCAALRSAGRAAWASLTTGFTLQIPRL